MCNITTRNTRLSTAIHDENRKEELKKKQHLIHCSDVNQSLRLSTLSTIIMLQNLYDSDFLRYLWK